MTTKREYDGAHRVKRVSNPTSTGAYVYTVTDYDAMSRPVLVTDPAGVRLRSAVVSRQDECHADTLDLDCTSKKT